MKIVTEGEKGSDRAGRINQNTLPPFLQLLRSSLLIFHHVSTQKRTFFPVPPSELQNNVQCLETQHHTNLFSLSSFLISSLFHRTLEILQVVTVGQGRGQGHPGDLTELAGGVLALDGVVLGVRQAADVLEQALGTRV
eukprot:289205_1